MMGAKLVVLRMPAKARIAYSGQITGAAHAALA